MRLSLLFSGTLALCLVLGGGDADAGPEDTRVKDTPTKACGHYVNRARFKDRGAGAEFVVILADSCLAALRSLGSDRTAEREAAAVFLDRLQILRDTVIDMNMQRVFGKDYTPVTPVSGPKVHLSEPFAKVSATGEYLIAHRMGLLAARRAWLDTGPDLALASPDGG